MKWLIDAMKDIWAPQDDEFWKAPALTSAADHRAFVLCADGKVRPIAEATMPELKKPKLVIVNHAPSRDEFATWRDDPTTQFVFAALRVAALEQKTAWDDVSWHGGEANEKLLTELRTRADAYEAMEAGDYEDFCSWAGVEPERLADSDNDAA